MSLLILARISLFILTLGALSVTAQADTLLKRGINVNPWFTRPSISDGEYLWPPYPPYDRNSFRPELESIRASGFDFIRMPVTTEPLLRADSAERISALANLRIVVSTALEVGLKVVFDLHPPTAGKGSYPTLFQTTEGEALYTDLVKDVTKHIVLSDTDKILVEPLNEPTGECADGSWNAYQVKLVGELRAEFPDVKFLITSTCYSSVTSFIQLDLSKFAKDPNIFATFHFYYPHVFTHQGATWSGGLGLRVLTGLAWPPSTGDVERTMAEVRRFAPANAYYQIHGDKIIDLAEEEAKQYYSSRIDDETLKDLFNKVAEAADRQGFPRSRIILGEFGVLKRERRWKGADMESAARWIKTVREAAEHQGFSWAMWSYKEGLALTVSDDSLGYFPELSRALGLSN